jgi:hypothetical protein
MIMPKQACCFFKTAAFATRPGEGTSQTAAGSRHHNASLSDICKTSDEDSAPPMLMAGRS